MIIRVIILPLTLKQLRAAKAMSRIQPEVAKLQKKYDTINDARTEFTQEVLFGLTKAKHSFKGTMYMKKGNKYRIELEDQTLVTDGLSVWSYIKSTNQVIIDRYKDSSDRGLIQVELGTEGYPPDLETLVNGVDVQGKKVRFLRRIPVDPLTGTPEWGLRAMQDEPNSTSWGGQNVFDVYSKAEGTALDGTKYSEW